MLLKSQDGAHGNPNGCMETQRPDGKGHTPSSERWQLHTCGVQAMQSLRKGASVTYVAQLSCFGFLVGVQKVED